MRLVDQDREAPAAMLVADFLQDERKLLHRGDDDLLAALDEFAQVARVFGMTHGGSHLGELLDGVADLLVQKTSIRYDDDRIEEGLTFLMYADKLMSEPGNGVRLA